MRLLARAAVIGGAPTGFFPHAPRPVRQKRLGLDGGLAQTPLWPARQKASASSANRAKTTPDWTGLVIVGIREFLGKNPFPFCVVQTSATGSTLARPATFCWYGGGQHWMGPPFLQLGRSRQGRQSKTHRRVPTEHLPITRTLIAMLRLRVYQWKAMSIQDKRGWLSRIMWVALVPSIHNRRQRSNAHDQFAALVG